MRPLIQIVPFRSTNPDGVGDYARLIADRLKAEHGLSTHFIVANPDEGTAKLDDGWPTTSMADRNEAALKVAIAKVEAQTGAAPILLHLSAYGFHNRGIPLWLPGAVLALRKARPERKFITVFHELFASGRPWQSAFWVGWLQARIAARIAGLSDGALTTVGVYEDWLRPQMRSGAPLVRAPVFSNMGEPEHVPPTIERPNRLVVFGTGGLARLAYQSHSKETEAAVLATGVTEIVDVGSRSFPLPQAIGGVSIAAKGRLEANAVSRELLGARYAILPYDPARLSKSTIFAALAAHGVVPICIAPKLGGADGLQPNAHYLPLPPGGALPPVTIEDATRVQTNLLNWYAQFGLSHCCRALACLIEGHAPADSEPVVAC